MTKVGKRKPCDEDSSTPMTEAEWRAAKRVSRVVVIRRALGLSQEDFATRYQIPIGTLRDWEQQRKKPDAAAKAYLRAIAGNPEAVWRALEKAPAA